MPTYVVLYKLTDQGIKNIKGSPKRIEKRMKTMEDRGGKLISFYSTMGEYDYVSIVEAPSDEVLMTQLLETGTIGNVRSTTLKAFTQKEFAAMIDKIE